MKWVGLTGGIGTGKSTVAQILRQKGLPIVDADTYSHKALEKPEVIQKIQQHFKDPAIWYLDPSTSKMRINRRSLGRIIFNNPQKKAILENILHPEIKAMTYQRKKALEESQIPVAVYDVPLLFEKNMQSEFDFIVLVACDPKLVMERLQKRKNNLEEDTIKQIMNQQMPQKQKLSKADFVIWNNTDIKDLEIQCNQFCTNFIGF